MIKLTISKIEGFNYYLKDINDKEYNFKLEFHDLPKEPKVNDFVYINESLLKEANNFLSFGSLSGEYGREIKDANDEDLLILVIDDEKIFLKRFYG